MKVIPFFIIFVKKEIMIVLGIILGIVCLVFGFIILFSYVNRLMTKKEVKDWEVGDSVFLRKEDKLFKLLGWTLKNVYIDVDGLTHKIDMDNVGHNKSAIWRRNYNECKSVMKTEPGFKPGLRPNSDKSTVCDGKVIELMSEIECQVYLKQALESEDFETAAKIREQLNKYR